MMRPKAMTHHYQQLVLVLLVLAAAAAAHLPAYDVLLATCLLLATPLQISS